MKEENCWDVFRTSGDPLAYIIYSKTRDIKNKSNNEKKDDKNRFY